MDNLSEKISEQDRFFMNMACDIAFENIDKGGGPFGAVIAKGDKIISTGANTVTIDNDPTAHAEVNAIRSACRETGNFKLEGCTVYSSCEPCPMCLSALYWAGVSKIYFGNTKEDARIIDFDDKFIYDEIEKAPLLRYIPCIRMEDTKAIQAFEKWTEKTDKIAY